jgi:hypothetical protein
MFVTREGFWKKVPYLRVRRSALVKATAARIYGIDYCDFVETLICIDFTELLIIYSYPRSNMSIEEGNSK